MANNYGDGDDNPFGSDYSNPFESNSQGAYNDNFPGVDEEAGGFPGSNNNNNNNNNLEAAAPSPQDFGGSPNDGPRGRDLDRREAELNKREQHLAERANKLDSQGRIKNWPFPCWAIAYHSIKDDIMDRHKSLVRQFYLLFLSLQVITLWNWICIVAMAGGNTKENLSWPAAVDAIFASVYLLAVPFFSWRLWYRVWYNWSKRGKGHFMWFSLWFFVHLAWTCAMLVGVPTGAGLLVMFDQYAGSEGLMGTFALVCSACWGLHLLYAVYLYKRAHFTWKTSGVDEYVREQAKKMAVAEVKKEFGGNAEDGW